MTQLLAQKADFGNEGLTPPTTAFSEGSAEGFTALTNLELFISNAIGVLTVVASLFFIFYFFMGAFKWVTAGGDGGKVAKARDEMVQGVVGLIVIVAAYGLVGLVGRIVGLNILQPGNVLAPLIPN